MSMHVCSEQKHIALPIKTTFTFGSIKFINIFIYHWNVNIIYHYTSIWRSIPNTFVNNKHSFLLSDDR